MTSSQSTMTWSEMWSLCGRIFHAGNYRAVYSDVLAGAIGSPEKRILDTACGVGFPLLELIDRGYHRITGADADATLLGELSETLKERGLSVPLVHTSWQEITHHIAEQYDVVLNTDASICLMDSWGVGTLSRGQSQVFERITSVLQNFHQLVAPGGGLIIGLQKNSTKSHQTHRVVDVGQLDVGGHQANLVWELEYDWDTRIKRWNSVLTVGEQRYERLLELYLCDKRELTDMLLTAGFSHVAEVQTPAQTYDDLLYAYR